MAAEMDAPTMDVLRKQAIAMAMLWLTARDYQHEGGLAWFHIRASDLGLREDVLAGKRIRVTIEAGADQSGLGDGAERRVEAVAEKRRAALGHAQRLGEVATMLRGAKQALELDAACDCDRAAAFIRSHLTSGMPGTLKENGRG